MAVSPPKKRRERLVGFRLDDVPLELRLRAARQLAKGTSASAVPEAHRPEDALFLRLFAPAATDEKTYRRVAEEPSLKVHWIRASAWNKVMGRYGLSR